jgi:hypothetical protein
MVPQGLIGSQQPDKTVVTATAVRVQLLRPPAKEPGKIPPLHLPQGFNFFVKDHTDLICRHLRLPWRSTIPAMAIAKTAEIFILEGPGCIVIIKETDEISLQMGLEKVMGFTILPKAVITIQPA